MKLDLDPIWPWSDLRQFLADAEPAATLATWLAALTALALPILLQRPWSRSQRLRCRVGGGLLLAGLLLWVGAAAGSSPSTTGGERLRGMALSLLVVVPLGMLGWTIRTYLQAPGVTVRRLGTVLTLRLLAFLLAAVAVGRPYLGFPDRTRVGGLIYILIDTSESMTIQDESGKTRWEFLQKTLADSESALNRLREEQQIDVEFFRFDRDTSRYQLEYPGKPEGRRSDIASAMRWLYDNRDHRPLRGLLILSDGRLTGPQRFNPLNEAKLWKKLPCPIHTVLYGDPRTSNTQNDIAVTSVVPKSTLIPVKSKITVTATIDALGLLEREVRVKMLLDGKEVPCTVEIPEVNGEETNWIEKKDGKVKMSKPRNEVQIHTEAPDKPGELKITVRAEDPHRPGKPLPEEKNLTNNELSTLVSIIKGGLSVLLVDKARVWEPQAICDALDSDPRITLDRVWLRGTAPVDANAAKLFKFNEKKYDVIIFGDVTAQQVQQANPNALEEIVEQVGKGAGFLMIGGYHAFGSGDWKSTPIEKLLPVDLSVTGQDDREIQMVPTGDGLRLYGYVLGMADGKTESEKAAWARLPPLEGMSKIKVEKGGLFDNVLAQSKTGEPILVTKLWGKGRTMAFAGDTTHRWIRDEAGKLKHNRFWRQMVVWLAQQDKESGNVWVKPDKRDVPVGTELGFSVGVRSQGGLDLPDGVFEVEIVGPGKPPHKVQTARVGAEDRGVFKPDEAGEYLVKVKGTAKDAEGKEVTGQSEARFLVNEEDVEMTEWAADADFMKKLAKEGRGQAITGAKLADFIKELAAAPAGDGKPRLVPWPTWRTTDRSGFLVTFFLLFVAALTAEWILRRYWGMV
jgi:uncharacterized membrane protein